MGPPRLCPACSATLRWIEMDSGKRFPVDPVPAPRSGNIAARPVGTGRTQRYVAGYVISARHPLRPGFVAFDSHYRACDMRPRGPRGTLRTPKPRPDFLF